MTSQEEGEKEMRQQLKKETHEDNYYKYVILIFSSWFFLCTACVSLPTASREKLEDDLMEMIVLYENIMPKVYDDGFYFNEHNKRYLDVQYKKLERIADHLAVFIESRPSYVKDSGFHEIDPAIQVGLKPVLDNLTLTINAYQAGDLVSSRKALTGSVGAVVVLTSSPAIGKVGPTLSTQSLKSKLVGETAEAKRSLKAMKLAKFNLLAKDFHAAPLEKNALEPTANVNPGLAQFRSQGSALHNQLRSAQSSIEKVAALYDLGQFYTQYQVYDKKGLASTYLQSCIKVLPGSQLAGKCFVVLQQNILNRYSKNSGVIDLAYEDQKLLNEMKILSQPQVLSVGMVGGLENFY